MCTASMLCREPSLLSARDLQGRKSAEPAAAIMPTGPVQLVDGRRSWQQHSSLQHGAIMQHQHGIMLATWLDGADDACSTCTSKTTVNQRLRDWRRATRRWNQLKQPDAMGEERSAPEVRFTPLVAFG